MDTWHRRMGHAGYDKVRETAKRTEGCHITNPKATQDEVQCKGCLLGKSKKDVSRELQRRAFEPWEYVHLDTDGPLENEGLNGEKYQVTATDDCTRLMKGATYPSKKDAWLFVQELFRFVKTQYGRTIKCFRLDNGTEFGGKKQFEDLCRREGCTWEYSDPHTQEQNGVSESSNKKINSSIRCITIDNNLPLDLWPELYQKGLYILIIE
ncbi:hypothetical protein BOTNAR_1037g00010 [Botryotinia narcissicola]|uniref:Integrase catalytic domain-containing protein n=1 Tax=Botryotinia narcissicola TaxID=278944 RepID=A0A4Z1H4Q2_9HELO|nr:hypothetical protein BOTNAR_1037g00010 [Botryotinia narcissicola]